MKLMNTDANDGGHQYQPMKRLNSEKTDTYCTCRTAKWWDAIIPWYGMTLLGVEAPKFVQRFMYHNLFVVCYNMLYWHTNGFFSKLMEWPQTPIPTSQEDYNITRAASLLRGIRPLVAWRFSTTGPRKIRHHLAWHGWMLKPCRAQFLQLQEDGTQTETTGGNRAIQSVVLHIDSHCQENCQRFDVLVAAYFSPKLLAETNSATLLLQLRCRWTMSFSTLIMIRWGSWSGLLMVGGDQVHRFSLG